jgi:hypothetical protein
MGPPAPTSSLPTPAGQPMGAHGGAGEPPTPLVSFMPTMRPAVVRPTRVLICVHNAGVRELIGLLLADAGCAVTDMDVTPWLAGDSIPGPPCEVLILDAWPLRYADVATQAHARLVAQPAALVLLMDSPQPAQLADQLGAVATLPLLFTLQDLVSAVQLGSRARAREPRGQSYGAGP